MQKLLEKEDFLLECVDVRNVGNEDIMATMSALQFQHKFFLREMQGALLPSKIVLNGNEVVMDFPSGPGSWCIDVSHRYSSAQVWGVDINQAAIDLALENAAQCCFGNVHFQLIDYPCVLPFADETFDVIHLQNSTSLFSFHQWPRMIAEAVRLLKPGGWLNLVDFEMGFASQPAVDRVLTFFGQILAKMDRSATPDGRLPLTGGALGPRRMSQQCFTDIGYHLYPVDLGGWNNLAGRMYLAQCLLRPEMIVFLAERTGISTAKELRPLLWEMQRELRQLRFCGVGVLLSAFGRKPLKSETSEDLTTKAEGLPLAPPKKSRDETSFE